uniref:Haloacid dehalogenase superfamily, subfamily IA, variant 3 with third motif having DD or ED/haloacid dehalogenase superfamily, subfamily IA, variant 1 with third motif having Dx(3-4)D or Dx(3-4)E n=1 Tax=Candidatus Kentrum sp. DK TaxID=2126562 RepID=A0A450SNE8_9GAMM|nr:MAG: haloacid dehalogenase superfamily, subfamily IA, variant 3 with third motif having DD or ED/haloacid dehalogenase superfamily, subfamily IA, variant 1 with third motif having Dx(3-4)D or Dx(3-4)E [Candidatus Kentron sp. DK]VFJ55408.1 MAG: haloacid dehalogenase superfamily, subfamily IA, variant 3 with third motif having DD or ED/haloacid dehalogenase superfamily, subfamily IA, variant 1 with third motif having Dx(3-4)D or Dx(3-4)E [Candidatus Kentron sp. DK]
MFIFFDIGSTLIDGPPWGPARRLVDRLGLAPESRTLLNGLILRTPLEDPQTLADYLISQYNADSGAAIREADTLWQAQIQEAREIPGAREVLRRLREAEIPYGFISNIWRPFYQGFERLFREEIEGRPCFLSFERGLAKPDTALYWTALDALQLSPEKTIMVGDTYKNDMAPAMAMGMKALWVLRRPEKERPDLIGILNGQRPPPDHTLASIEHLKPELFHSLLISR